MIRRIITILLISLPIFMFGQTSGKISGKVADADGNPLQGANIIVEGTSFGTASDQDGAFVILNVPVGTYTLRCDYIGYSALIISNVAVSSGLTTGQDFGLAKSAIEGDVVEVRAERPLINKNSTNTTRIVGSETIVNLPLRGVESIIALQTGTVADDGNIYVRGSRAGDVAYYVDGVYMNNAYTLNNTSTVSNSAMEEVQFQSGGFSAEYGNVNGGVVNTTTKVGGSSIDVSGEFVNGLGSSGTGAKDELFSYGYNLYNLNVGGPITDKIKFYVSYEGRSSDDSNPTKHSFYSMDRTEIPWSLDSVAAVVDDPATADVDESVAAYLGLSIDGNLIGDWTSFEVDGAAFNTSLEGVAADSISGYSLVDVTNKAVGDTTSSIISAYNNDRDQYGTKPNSGSDRQTITGNLSFDLGALRLKLGGLVNNSSGRSYNHSYSLLNSANNPKWENNTLSMYANLALAISDKSYIKVKVAMFNYNDKYGDNTWWDAYNDYGNVTGDSYLREIGKNPIALQEFSYYSAYGTVYDDYDYNETSYISLKADYVNQLGDHEIKAGFDYRDNEIKYYRLAQPMEIAQEYAGVDAMPEDETWVFNTYRNAYAENLGCTVDGDCNATSGNGYTDPGSPVVLGAYVQDKIELEDLIVNLGVRFDQFSPNTQEAADWSDLWLADGKLDKERSGYKDVDPYTYINPRVGFSFPVSDKTKIHAQYGKFTQHPILNRLYLSDTRLASNFTQGNMTVSPNPSLKPEQTTQYEVGLAQQIGGFAALGITAFYKEIRDYTMMANVIGAKQNGALFSWAQYMNGDFGVVKGMSANLNMRRVNGLMANVSYTMSFAEGTGSDPASNWNIAWTGDTYPTMINPLEYDQRHTGSVMVDYRLDDGGLMANTGVNLLYQFGSGTAYTPSRTESAIFGRGWYAPTAAVNSAYKPWTSTLDLKIDTDVKIASLNVSVYLLVLNVLDTDNVDEVYAGSGDAANDGYLNTLSGKTWATGNPAAVDFYNARLQDPRNWDAPRQVRVGLTFGL